MCIRNTGLGPRKQDRLLTMNLTVSPVLLHLMPNGPWFACLIIHGRFCRPHRRGRGGRTKVVKSHVRKPDYRNKLMLANRRWPFLEAERSSFEHHVELFRHYLGIARLQRMGKPRDFGEIIESTLRGLMSGALRLGDKATRPPMPGSSEMTGEPGMWFEDMCELLQVSEPEGRDGVNQMDRADREAGPNQLGPATVAMTAEAIRILYLRMKLNTNLVVGPEFGDAAALTWHEAATGTQGMRGTPESLLRAPAIPPYGPMLTDECGAKCGPLQASIMSGCVCSAWIMRPTDDTLWSYLSTVDGRAGRRAGSRHPFSREMELARHTEGGSITNRFFLHSSVEGHECMVQVIPGMIRWIKSALFPEGALDDGRKDDGHRHSSDTAASVEAEAPGPVADSSTTTDSNSPSASTPAIIQSISRMYIPRLVPRLWPGAPLPVAATTAGETAGFLHPMQLAAASALYGGYDDLAGYELRKLFGGAGSIMIGAGG